MELALYKLAETGKISLEQAKILKTTYNNSSTTFKELLEETNLDETTLALEINELLQRKILSFAGPKYYLENFPEKISELIREERTEMLNYSKVR